MGAEQEMRQWTATKLAWFDARQTVECGQLFRYEIFENADTMFGSEVTAGNANIIICVISCDKVCFLKQCDDCVQMVSNDEPYFLKYFDTHTDYGCILQHLQSFEELAEALAFGRGIRILRQDLMETIVGFVLSANNNIPRIRGTLAKLACEYGDKLDAGGLAIGKELYAFPTPLQLQQVGESDWQRMGAGYRAAHLVRVVEQLSTQNVLQRLQQLSYLYRQEDGQGKDKAQIKQEICKTLLSLQGVGPKVADCILLFGLG
ncbi:MAG: hypothetical protein FWD76_04570, partial [Firmicutes bacterium]|nr:hypothetical protein [Bacillota bacterium]